MATIAEDFQIVGSYNNQRVVSIDAERSVNCFEYIDKLGKKPRALIGTSGLTNTQVIPINVSGVYRAQYVFKDIEYDVIGSDVIRIDSIGNVSVIGTLENTDSGYVGVDANTFQVIFVDGVDGYIWDTLANTFTKITDTSFPALPIDVCTLDNFFVVANGNTNQFQLSMFDQGLVWGPASLTVTADSTTDELTLSSTDNFQTGVPFQISSTGTLPTGNPAINSGVTYYAIRVDAIHIKIATSPENARAGIAIDILTDGTPTITITSNGQLQLGEITSHPGNIVACRTLHRRLFLFSNFFTEVWENQGIGTNLPFRRNNSLLIEYGTPAIGSIAVSFDTMVFLSQSRDGLGPVTQVNGTQAMTISTRALDFVLAGYAAQNQVSDCRAFLIKENGLIFYRMNFTQANHTWVYNLSLSNPTEEESRLWHEEEVLNGDRHPAQTHAYFNGVNYVGHYQLPVRYRVDSANLTNDNEPIRRMRIARPFVPPGYQRRRVDRFQLDMLQGQIPQQINIQELPLLTEFSEPILTESGVPIIASTDTIYATPKQPYIFLSLSKDGGQTYGYIQKSPMGKVGERTFRTLWRKLGVTPRGQAEVVKIEMFAPVPFIVLGASWAYEVLPE